MKFLCPNCKAKYQISDEKIAGRTLKMDCRRCNHPIVIRGDKAAGGSKGSGRSSRPAPGAGRRRGGSGVGPAPARSSRTALGADFRKNPGPAAPAQKTTALDQWYVAINDVPVGPMKRGEIANKIAAGAIDGGSLSWREGFDDWRELKNIPELAALLQKARPAPPKPAFPSPGRGLGGRAPARPARPPSSRTQAPRPTGGAEASRPAARGNVVPIGGRLGAAAAPALDELPQNDFDDEPTRVGAAIDFEAMEREAREEAEREAAEAAAAEEEEQKKPVGVAFGGDSDVFDPFASQAGAAAVGSSPGVASSPGAASSPGFAPAPSGFEAAPASPPPAAVPVERRRRAIPIGAWIAIAGAMAFGVALAVMVGTHLLQQPGTPEVATAEPTAPAEPQEPNAPTLDTEVPEEPAEPAEEESAAAEEGDAEEPEEASDPAPRRGTTNNQGTSRTQRGGGSGSGSSGSGSSGSGSSGSGSSGSGSAPRPDPRFDRFADDGAGVATIGQRPSSVLDERRETGGGTLNADQIRTVVNRERSAVTRCYETAARQSGRAPSVRVDVDVTVGGSGTVTRARARGQAFGNLHECIERSVRRWRFPASGGQTQTSIPFVFQGRD